MSAARTRSTLSPDCSASEAGSIVGSHARSTETSSASAAASSVASASRTPPSPENPRDASGDSVSVSRIPGSTTSQALATGAPSTTGGPYTRRAVAWRSTRSRATSRSGPGRHTAPGTGRVVGRRAEPEATTHWAPRAAFPERRGSERRNATACAADSSARRSNPAEATCASANPRSHRSGSGTFFSTSGPSTVVTASSSGPTRRCSGSSAVIRDRASRSGLLTSTLVVP